MKYSLRDYFEGTYESKAEFFTAVGLFVAIVIVLIIRYVVTLNVIDEEIIENIGLRGIELNIIGLIALIILVITSTTIINRLNLGLLIFNLIVILSLLVFI